MQRWGKRRERGTRWRKGRDEIGDPSRAQFTRASIVRCAQPCINASETKGIALTASLLEPAHNLAIAPTYALLYIVFATARWCVHVNARARAFTSFYREIKGIPT